MSNTDLPPLVVCADSVGTLDVSANRQVFLEALAGLDAVFLDDALSAYYYYYYYYDLPSTRNVIVILLLFDERALSSALFLCSNMRILQLEDKSSFRRWCREHNSDNFLQRAAQPSRLPAVAKWERSRCSAGIQLIRVEEEDWMGLDAAQTDFVVEEDIQVNREFSFQFVASKGILKSHSTSQYQFASHMCHCKGSVGGSVDYVCKQVACPPAALPVLQTLVATLEYDGGGTVDFKIDREGHPWILELNPRVGLGMVYNACMHALHHSNAAKRLTARLRMCQISHWRRPAKNEFVHPS